MKKIISILICIQIALFPAFAFAANVGGWTLGGGVAQGASTVYEGTKRVVIDGVDYIKKGTAKITPPASGVAKVLARGAAGYALSVAVEQLLGSVDWVLDPANNQIVYKKPRDITDPNDPALQYYYTDNYTPSASGVKFTSLSAACSSILKTRGWKAGIDADCILSGNIIVLTPVGKPSSSFGGHGYRIANPAYNPSAEKDEEKTLPLDAVASQVISNAQGGDTNAQSATMAAAADIVDEASKDDAKARPIAQQLESSAQTKPADEAAAEKANEAQGQSKPNEANPEAMDLSLEFPVFCGWAPLVCEAAQVVISFPNTLTGWWDTTNQKADSWASSIAEAWASVKEWATSEPDLQEDQTDLPIEEQTLDRDPSSFDTDYIVLGSQCPSFEPYTVEVGPISKTLSMDLSPLCDFAAQVRPAILGMSYLTAAGIVVAAIRET
jgi:hypothetical protein